MLPRQDFDRSASCGSGCIPVLHCSTHVSQICYTSSIDALPATCIHQPRPFVENEKKAKLPVHKSAVVGAVSAAGNATYGCIRMIRRFYPQQSPHNTQTRHTTTHHNQVRMDGDSSIMMCECMCVSTACTHCTVFQNAGRGLGVGCNTPLRALLVLEHPPLVWLGIRAAIEPAEDVCRVRHIRSKKRPRRERMARNLLVSALHHSGGQTHCADAAVIMGPCWYCMVECERAKRPLWPDGQARQQACTT